MRKHRTALTKLLVRRYLFCPSVFVMMVILALATAISLVTLSVMDGSRLGVEQRILLFQDRYALQAPRGDVIKDYDVYRQKMAQSFMIASRISPLIERKAVVVQKGIPHPVRVFGLEGKNASCRIPSLTAGSMKGFEEGEGVILGLKLSESLSVSVGDTVSLGRSSDPHATKPYKVLGLLRIGLRTYDAHAVVMPLSLAQDLFKMPDAVTNLELHMDPSMMDFDEKLFVETFLKQMKHALPNTFRFVDWKSSNVSYQAESRALRGVIPFLLGLCVVLPMGVTLGFVLFIRSRREDFSLLEGLTFERETAIRALFYRVFLSLGGISVGVGSIVGLWISCQSGILDMVMDLFEQTHVFVGEVDLLASTPLFWDVKNMLAVVTCAGIVFSLGALIPARCAARLFRAESIKK